MARATYRRRRRPAVRGLSLVYIACLALLAGWYGPTWVNRIERSMPNPPVQTQTPLNSVPADRLSAQFAFCNSGGGVDCVVDGDTFWFDGEKYRIADIDTPETHGPACVAERALGARATQRLHALMNDGPFSLERTDRDTDRYGRALRVVTRAGQSIGGQLVAEGLARDWDGARRPWC